MAAPGPPGPDADTRLAALGAELADAVARALPQWAADAVAGVLGAWRASGAAGSAGVETAVVVDRVRRAAAEAAAGIGDELRAALAADVDRQRTTPLAVVRGAVAVPTAALAEAGVPPVVRDRFAEARFPEDPYGLTPASLASLSAEVGELALAWGAAKAAAHRARHRPG
ncbi:MAG: hypothetical protein KGJ77_07660 [Acidobacteriota bacterium]|nr:hypothetical protein [Acidobacteriota bacterium]